MSKAWEYTRSRRYLMQAVTWVVLGLVTALASVVAAHRRSASAVTLGSPQTIKQVTLKAPKGWEISAQRDESSPTILEATESRRYGEARRLVLTRDVVPLDQVLEVAVVPLERQRRAAHQFVLDPEVVRQLIRPREIRIE